MNPTPDENPLLALIRRSGPLTFERYMELCLYHPEFGYYRREFGRTGVRGDYFTSPDLHPIFARLTARQAAEMWTILGKPGRFAWVEMGPGNGRFAVDFLRWTERSRPEFREALEYIAIEPGDLPREALHRKLSDEGFADSVRVVASLEQIESVTGCFFSNELVDSFPVAVVARVGGRLKEVYVSADESGLRESYGPISDSRIAAAVARYAKDLNEGDRVEVNRRAAIWMGAVAEKLVRGFVITIDYGDLAERLYTPDRQRGTLLACRNHRVSEDFYQAPGEQDLTSHVNFSALIDEGKVQGLELTGLTTQEKFLMALGETTQFEDLYDAGMSEAEKLEARLKLKRLIFPGESGEGRGMGDIFKVLIQHRGMAAPLLTGLRYEKSAVAKETRRAGAL